MDKNDKKGPGLHKEVSAIFDGVAVPGKSQDTDVEQSSAEAPKSHSGSNRWMRATSGGPQEPTPPALVAPKRAEPKPLNRRAELIKKLMGRLLPDDMDESAVRRQKFMALLIPVLSVVLVLTFVKVLSGPSRSQAAVEAMETQDVTEEESDEVQWSFPEPLSLPERDPMQSEAAATAAQADSQSTAGEDRADNTVGRNAGGLQGVEVTGILYSDDKPAAIVGTQIVHIGDEVHGARVVSIDRDSVTLEMGNTRWKQDVRP